MQTIQYRKSRISEMKEDEYTKSLAKNQVCAIFHMGGIRKFYPNFLKLCVVAVNQQKHVFEFPNA